MSRSRVIYCDAPEWAGTTWSGSQTADRYFDLAPPITDQFYKIKIYSVHFYFGSFGIGRVDAEEPADCNWLAVLKHRYIRGNAQTIAHARYTRNMLPFIKDPTTPTFSTIPFNLPPDVRDTHWIFPKGIEVEGRLWIQLAEGGMNNVDVYAGTTPMVVVAIEYEIEKVDIPTSMNVWIPIIRKLKGDLSWNP